MQAYIWRVEFDLIPVCSIIQCNRNGSLYANQKLVQELVSMLATHFLTWNIEDKEIPLWSKGQMLANLTKCQFPAEILNDWEVD